MLQENAEQKSKSVHESVQLGLEWGLDKGLFKTIVYAKPQPCVCIGVPLLFKNQSYTGNSSSNKKLQMNLHN